MQQLLLCFMLVVAAASGVTTVQHVVEIDLEAPLHHVLTQYVSADLDWWTGENGGSGGGWSGSGLLSIDLRNKRLKNMAAALSPGILRLGGSLDTAVKYAMDDATVPWCEEPVTFRNELWHVCLNRTRWDSILGFASDAGLDLVLGLAWPGIRGFADMPGLQDTAIVPPWNHTNPEALLRYTQSVGHKLFAVELGEEMAPGPGTKSFSNLVGGYAQLRELLRGIWPTQTPRVLGPCVGMGNEADSNGTTPFMHAFLNDTISRNLVDGVCLHSYNNDGGDGWQRPGFLNETLKQAEAVLGDVRSFSKETPVWCGECGPHNGGGIQNVTDRFISSLWYADALGGLARLGLEEFGRQSLVGSHYGLLEPISFSPNPDFWTAVLWTRIMGTAVLNVSVALPSTEMHVYAHCSVDGDGDVGLAFVNIANESAELELSWGGEGISRQEWHLTAASMDAKTVLLNGRALSLTASDELPELPPVERDAGETLKLAPLSYGFAVFKGVGATACT